MWINTLGFEIWFQLVNQLKTCLFNPTWFSQLKKSDKLKYFLNNFYKKKKQQSVKKAMKIPAKTVTVAETAKEGRTG